MTRAPDDGPTLPRPDPAPPSGGAGSAADAPHDDARRGPARLSRRSVLQAAGVLAAGGLGVVAGYGARGMLDASGPGDGAPPSGPPPKGLVAGETGAPGAASDTPDVGDRVPRHAFRSRPDLRPPVALLGASGPGAAEGRLFLTPNNGEGPDGPVIYDADGEPVWIHDPAAARATDFHVVEWDGRPALAWWEGEATIGVGDGSYVIADETYAEVARVGEHVDLHELRITPRGTAWLIAYRRVPLPPDAAGASSATPAPRELFDCVVEEVDLRTGERRFSWHSAEHVPPDESHAPYPDDPDTTWDPVHVNSIDEDADGNLLVSARNTSCVYFIDRATGQVRWRLGGRRGDLELLDGLSIGLQHDARRQPDGTITIFDNRRPPEAARGIVVEVDEAARTARLVRTYERPEPLHASSQGSYQVLPNGNVLVGWGSQAVLTEFAPDGLVVLDATLPAGIQSYRDRRHPWTGRPSEPPAVAADPVTEASGSQWRVTAYASWNGATEVAAWRLLAGPADGDLEPLSTMARTGFETVVTGVTTTEAVTRVQVIALGADGGELGASEVLEIG